MRPFSRAPFGMTTLFVSRTGLVTTAVTASPAPDDAVPTCDSSLASSAVPAGIDVDCARTKIKIEEMIPISALQLSQFVDNFCNRLSQIAGADEIERSGMERFHELLELVENIIH